MPVALYLLAVAVFAMGTSEFMLAGLVPDLAADIGVSVGTAGLLTSGFAVGMVVGAPLAAALARHWPARTSLCAFVVVFLGCHVVAAVTSSFALLFATRVVAALANAGFLAVALAVARRLVPYERTGRALAVLLSGTTVATIAGVPGGALLGAWLGWRAAFWAVALVCVLALAGVATVSVDSPAAPVALRTELAVLRRRPVILAVALAAVVNAATFATFTYLAPIVTNAADLSTVLIPVVLVLFGLGSFVGVTLAGRFSDSRPAMVVGLTLPLTLLGWATLALTAEVLLLPLAFVLGLLSFALGSTLIAGVLRAASLAPSMSGSYATAALNVGAVVGPVAASLALAVRPDPRAPVWVSVALTGIAVLVLVLGRQVLALPRPGT